MYKIELFGAIQTIHLTSNPPNHYLTLTVLAKQANRFGTIEHHWIDCTLHNQFALQVQPHLQPNQFVFIEGLEAHYPHIGRKGKNAGKPTYKKKIDVYCIRIPELPLAEFRQPLPTQPVPSSDQTPDLDPPDLNQHEE